MTDRERHQADLLDQFRQHLAANPSQTPPADLDPGIAAIAATLQSEPSPPEPSARFVRQLEGRLMAQSVPTQTQPQPGVLPPSDAELSNATIPTDWPNISEPRRSRLSEFTRIAAAGFVVIIVGTLLVLLFRDMDNDPAAPGVGGSGTSTTGEILVSWDPNGGENYKLYIIDIDADGEHEPRKLTPGPHEDDGVTERFGSWSPDGQRVAFVREEGGQSDIWVMDASPGAEPVNLTSSPYGEHGPVWSPDGSKIAFTRDGDGGADIWIMDADGSNARNLTDTISGAVFPAWSPDGEQIAFARMRYDQAATSDSLQVWVMNADGSDPQPITDVEGIVGRPQWSPGGEWIAFHAASTIWAVKPDGSELRNLTDVTGATSHPDWSADGTIVHATGNFVDGTDGLAITNLKGDVQAQWTPKADVLVDPVWSPDDTQIAFYAGSDQNQPGDAFTDYLWDLRITSTDGSDERTLLTGSIDFRWPPAWRPVVDEAIHPSPDPTATPVIVTTATPAEAPEAWLAYGGQSQRGELSFACDWFDFPVCLAEQALRFPGDALEVERGTTLSFNLSELRGEDLVNVRAYAVLLDGDNSIELPDGNQLVVEQRPDALPLETQRSPLEITMTVDLNPGDYAVGVEVSLAPDAAAALESQTTGSATYGFHIRVTGLADAEYAPATWLTYRDQTQRGELAYGCMWPGHPVCVDPGGLTFPEEPLEVPEGATLMFSIEEIPDAEFTSFRGYAYPLDAYDVGDVNGMPVLWYPITEVYEPPMFGTPEAMNVVADLSPGEYAFAVDVSTTSGSATYGFHFRVTAVDGPTRDADTTGTIAAIEPSGGGISMHIIEHPDNPTGGDQYYVYVSPQARVFERDAAGVERRTLDDLAVGKRVTVAITGEVLDSYPGYATVSEVVIIRTETEGPIDPDDLVTMTFMLSRIDGSGWHERGDAFYVAWAVTGGESGEAFFCADDERAARSCAASYGFGTQVAVPRGAELTFTYYRQKADNPDQPELFKSGREVVDADMITSSFYIYGKENPGGYD